jgi:arsenite methyltransferase
VVLSNGVVNLAPDKARVFAEIHRVLRPGGRLYLADVVVARELSLQARSNPDLWAACVAGALTEPELTALCAELGFVGGRVTARFDAFGGTSAMERVAGDLRLQSVNFFAAKPGPAAVR